MRRQTVYDPDGGAVGWFRPDRATRYEERTRWDGNNHASLAAGHWADHEELYRTAQGRWVLHWWSQWQGIQDTWRYIGEGEAESWLIRCEYDDEEVAAATGRRPEEERGPGRPEIGPAFSVRMPSDLTRRLDDEATRRGLSRAGLIRELVEAALVDTAARGE